MRKRGTKSITSILTDLLRKHRRRLSREEISEQGTKRVKKYEWNKLTCGRIKQITREFMDEINKALLDNGRLVLPKIGTLFKKTYQNSRYYNLWKKSFLVKPKYKAMRFKMAEAFKKKLNTEK